MYIGIDQSYTQTAYVIIDDNTELVNYGTIKSDPKQDIFSRCTYILSELHLLISGYQVKRIAIEGLAFGTRGNATRDLAGLQFVLMIGLTYGNTRPLLIAPTSLKKLATGSGKASKEDMISHLPTNVYDQFSLLHKKSSGLHDLADAYYLALQAYFSDLLSTIGPL